MRKISVIATVLNEGRTIHHLLDSLLRQTHPVDEIIVVDGGSQDDTCAVIESYADRLPLTLLHEPGCNISEGRNRGIALATGEVIVITDAGVRLPDHWLANLTAPFQQVDTPITVAGFFLPDPDPANPFEVAMSATVLPLLDEIKPATFLPSSRSVAFLKCAWEKVGGYPEWLDYCEDLIFDLRLKQQFGDFVFVPEAAVYFKPRTSLTAFYKQYYLYARGDGKADLWRKRHVIRYVTYFGVIPGVAWLMRQRWWWSLLLFLGGGIYLQQPYRRLPHLWQQLDRGEKLEAIIWIPVIRIVGDVAKMIGYPVGWLWRLANHPPDWR